MRKQTEHDEARSAIIRGMEGHAEVGVERPTIPLATGAIEPLSADWRAAARRARLLSWVSLGWLSFEGLATTAAGLLAGSVALLGNGLDSAIEGLASLIVVWRFTGSRISSPTSERRAQQLVAASFFLLAPYIAFEAITSLVTQNHPETSWLGIGLSIGTLCVCPWLGRAKLRLGEQLGSSATAGEGRQNLICAYLATAVLASLLANTLLDVWWLDPMVGLGISVLAAWEGGRAWRGESCNCAACAAPTTAEA